MKRSFCTVLQNIQNWEEKQQCYIFDYPSTLFLSLNVSSMEGGLSRYGENRQLTKREQFLFTRSDICFLFLSHQWVTVILIKHFNHTLNVNHPVLHKHTHVQWQFVEKQRWQKPPSGCDTIRQRQLPVQGCCVPLNRHRRVKFPPLSQSRLMWPSRIHIDTQTQSHVCL